MSRAVRFACILMLLLAPQLRAQQPTASLSEISSRVLTGDRVRITLRDGTMVSGRFDSVSNSAIRLASGRSAREYPSTMVQQVSRQRPDSLANGILLGALAGAGTGALIAGTSCPNDPECAAITTVVFVPVFTGGGIAVGALIDALSHKYDPVYVQQAGDRPRLRISPVVAQNRKGVRLAFSF